MNPNDILNVYYTSGNKLMTSSGERYDPGNYLYDKYKGIINQLHNQK